MMVEEARVMVQVFASTSPSHRRIHAHCQCLLLYYGTAQKSSLEKMAGWRSKSSIIFLRASNENIKLPTQIPVKAPNFILYDD
jgi:hypothetical protein